jgi:hypothetical protein
MAGLVIASSRPLSGKTTLAAGIAGRLKAADAEVLISRTGEDANAAHDAGLFAAAGVMPAGAGVLAITECEAGDPGRILTDHAGSRVIIVATPADAPEEMVAYVRSSGPVVGVVVNRVPAKSVAAMSAAYESAGVRPLAVIPEDRVLAAPTVGQVAAALGAQGEHITPNTGRVLDHLVIASIAADPGQTYFTRTEAEAVIVRSDKPDLQLAALNAGAGCLIVTGGLPVLSYVLERVEDEEIPLLSTELDTRQTVAVIEALFGTAPFEGDKKLKQIDSLISEIDVNALIERAVIS